MRCDYLLLGTPRADESRSDEFTNAMRESGHAFMVE